MSIKPQNFVFIFICACRHVPVPITGAVAESLGYRTGCHAKLAFPRARSFQNLEARNHGRSHHGRSTRRTVAVSGNYIKLVLFVLFVCFFRIFYLFGWRRGKPVVTLTKCHFQSRYWFLNSSATKEDATGEIWWFADVDRLIRSVHTESRLSALYAI